VFSSGKRTEDLSKMASGRIFSSVAVMTIVCFVSATAGRGQSAPTRAATVACVYDDRSFSDGAHICIQKNLMMTCTVTGEKPVWTLVVEKELNERCLVPFQLHTADVNERQHYHAVRRTQARVTPTASASAACFTFNGKRYCE
jgi:hypothetical protein